MAAEERRSRMAGPTLIGQPFLVPLAAADSGRPEIFVGLQQCGGAPASGSSAAGGQTGEFKMMIVMDQWRRQWLDNLVIRRIPAQALLWMICLCVTILTGYGSTQTNKAKGEVWWSLKPVVRPALPDGPESNPIDRFINAELKVRGLKAIGAADKLTLLRRVYLDLIGLPPSPAEQEAFLADDSADAYEKVV